MTRNTQTALPFRLLLASIAIAFAFVLPSPSAHAQVALIVNGDPITVFDIDQTGKFIQLTQHKAATRQQIVDELIEQRLKVQIGKRYRLEITDQEVDTAYAEMASRLRLNAQQLTQQLAQGGVDASTLKDRIRADFSWQQIVRGKYQSSLQINDKDVVAALQARNKDVADTSGVEFTLRPILLVVSRNGGEGAVDARKRDAEALRARFENCEAGIPFARSLRDVVVREPIIKSSSDLAPGLRDVLDKTGVGHLTEPEVTSQGVQLFALCSRKETKVDSSAKRAMQNELFAQQFEIQAKRLMRELRKQAMIEVKDTGDAKPAAKAARANAR